MQVPSLAYYCPLWPCVSAHSCAHMLKLVVSMVTSRSIISFSAAGSAQKFFSLPFRNISMASGDECAEASASFQSADKLVIEKNKKSLSSAAFQLLLLRPAILRPPIDSSANGRNFPLNRSICTERATRPLITYRSTKMLLIESR